MIIAYIILVTSGVLAIGMGTFMILYARKERNSRIKISKETYSKAGENRRLQIMYTWFSRNRFTKRYLLEIRKRLQIVSGYKEHELRHHAVISFLKIIGISVSIIIVFALASNSVIMLLFIVLITVLLSETIIDIMVISIGNKLMEDQLLLSKRIRHNYSELHNIVDALEVSADDLSETNKAISRQAYKLHEIMTAKDIEQQIEDYNYSAPNKYLKQLLSMIFIASEYGDAYDNDGGSRLLSNLEILNEDIRLEVIKRRRISTYFRSLNVIPLVPLLFIAPFKSWAMGSFYPLAEFFDSNMGIVLDVIMYVVTIFSYYVIRNLQRLDGNHTSSRFKIGKVRWIRAVIKYLVPVEHTSKRRDIEVFLRESGTKESIYDHYAKKVIVAALSFIVTTIVLLVLHGHTVDRILNDPDINAVAETMLAAQPDPDDLQAAEEITAEDKIILEATNRSNDIGVISEFIAVTYEYSEEEANKIATRVQEKALTIKNQYFRWYELILALIIGIVGYFIPNIILAYQRRIMNVEIENEVSMYQMIILMLMNIERNNVDDVIEWMSSYSVIFRQELETCINEYDAGVDKALNNLRDSVEYKGFKELIDGLQTAANSLSLKQAFGELEAEQNYFFKMREDSNNRVVESKKGGGNLIGFLPMYTFLAFYFAFPLFYVGYSEMSQFYSQLMS